jgi:ribonuclease HI
MLSIYTDGACTGNGTDKARSSYALVFPGKEYSDYAALTPDTIMGKPTSNQRAELFAILHAVSIPHTNGLTIYTDSQYSIDAVTKWYPKWTAKGIIKKNMDILAKIAEYMANTIFVHVSGHSNYVYNNMADQYATSMLKK